MKTYLAIVAVFSLALCLAAGAYNYLTDPYQMFHYRSADEKTLSRIDQLHHLRVTKPWQIVEIRPTALIAGTSRAARLPAHPDGWQAETGYNAAIPGATPGEMFAFIQHAHRQGPLRKLTLSLDFRAFARTGSDYQSGFDADRLSANPVTLALQYLTDASHALLTFPSLATSIMVNHSEPDVTRTFYPDGTWVSRNTLLIGRPGFKHTARRVQEVWREEGFDTSNNMRLLEKMLAWCQQQNIETNILITPTHLFMNQLWMDLGQWEMWRHFHSSVVAINEETARSHKREPFKVWVFGNVAGRVDEPITTRTENLTAHFRDPVHFRSAFGTEMMATMWDSGKSCAQQIDSESVDSYLNSVEAMTMAFSEKHQASLLKLRDIAPPETPAQ